jgi:hypothetical protein
MTASAQPNSYAISLTDKLVGESFSFALSIDLMPMIMHLSDGFLPVFASLIAREFDSSSLSGKR